jgi:hypothetical protein
MKKFNKVSHKLNKLKPIQDIDKTKKYKDLHLILLKLNRNWITKIIQTKFTNKFIIISKIKKI